jgi:hypothetical protein
LIKTQATGSDKIFARLLPTSVDVAREGPQRVDLTISNLATINKEV